MGSETIFHIDVNSAYLSWSAIRRLQNGDPLDLRTIPSIIGGDQEKRHGIVLAKSIPAKKYGIQTADRRERAGFLGKHGQVRRRRHIAVVGRCGRGNGDLLLAVAVKVAAGKRHDRDFLDLPLPLRCLLIRG